MAMDINDMKDVFLFREHETADKMLKYIKEELKVKDADKWNYIGYDIISVPHKEYERVLLEGKKYAISKDYGMYWLDYYNFRRGPIASIDLGYAKLPEDRLEDEDGRYDRYFWDDDNYTPKSVVSYFSQMHKHFGPEIKKINREYHRGDNAIQITLVTGNIDYEKYRKLLGEFILECGYGPFEEIHPLTFTGEYEKEAFQKVKKENKKELD